MTTQIRPPRSIPDQGEVHDVSPDYDATHCDDCGELIDSATVGCVNPHCGETPHERMLRESEGE